MQIIAPLIRVRNFSSEKLLHIEKFAEIYSFDWPEDFIVDFAIYQTEEYAYFVYLPKVSHWGDITDVELFVFSPKLISYAIYSMRSSKNYEWLVDKLRKLEVEGYSESFSLLNI